MQGLRKAMLLVGPALAVALATVGCGGGSTPSSSANKSTTTSTPAAEQTTSSDELTPLKADGHATIKGKVTFVGDAPPAAELPIPDNNKDKAYCMKGEHRDQTWVVGPDKGVANVVIWLRPPTGKFFDVPADQQKPEQAVVKIDQPFCAFIPHVSVAFPSVYDAATKKQKRTGQKIEVVNSAEITHNTNWDFSNKSLDSGDNVILKAKEGMKEIEALKGKPTRPNQENLMSMKCNIHTWMNGYLWAFDHPYAAVTKEDGSFEIKNVPAGSKLMILAWHEPDSYLAPDGPGSKKGTEIGPLKDKETKEMNFKISK